jgi:hypothetical protein
MFFFFFNITFYIYVLSVVPHLVIYIYRYMCWHDEINIIGLKIYFLTCSIISHYLFVDVDSLSTSINYIAATLFFFVKRHLF